MSNLLFFVVVTLFILLATMLLSPLEALGWWSGWYQQPRKGYREFGSLPKARNPRPCNHYIVYLDGIAKGTPDNYQDVAMFIEKLQQALPDAIILDDVLPYSATNTPLTGNRPLSRFWQYARARKLKNNDDLLGFTINVHNLFQVLVSADSRYGTVFNYAQAERIIETLLEKGYQPGCGTPITLIGYSGGAQIAAGVAPYLKHLLRAPVDLISLGGVISADKGLLDVRFLFHITGSKDTVERLGTLLFPGRWAFVRGSSWNRAKHRGKFTHIPVGPIKHDSTGGYLDVNARLPDGTTFLDHTTSVIRCIIEHPEAVIQRRKRQGPFKYQFALESCEALQALLQSA
jgi:hypothetical protein